MITRLEIWVNQYLTMITNTLKNWFLVLVKYWLSLKDIG